MQQVYPALRITDSARSKQYYTEGLGFTIDWEHRFEPDFPVFMQITRDGMSMYLTEHAGDCQVGGLVHFYVDDVDASYEEFQSRAVVIHEPPSEDIEGLRMMTIIAPDGDQIRVATRV